MTLRVSAILGFLVLVLPLVSASHWSRRHQEVAHRARGDVDIHRRDAFTNARFTFYDVGLGACGQTNVASDWIVALNVEQYGNGYPGPQCFKQITIQFGGQTAVAIIMDECMGCPYGGLDFSRGLFDYFASESVGVLYGTWWFNDDSGGGGAPTTSSWDPPAPTTTWQPPPPPPPPTTTWQPPPPPTTTWQPPPPPPTTTWQPPPPPPTTSSTPAYTPPPTTTSTSSTPTTTSTSTSSLDLGTGLVSGLAVPTGAVVPVPQTGSPQNLLVINSILVEVGIALSASENM